MPQRLYVCVRAVRKMKYRRRGCEGIKRKKERRDRKMSRKKELGQRQRDRNCGKCSCGGGWAVIPFLYMNKSSCELDMVSNAYNLSMWEAGAGELQVLG